MWTLDAAQKNYQERKMIQMTSKRESGNSVLSERLDEDDEEEEEEEDEEEEEEEEDDL